MKLTIVINSFVGVITSAIYQADRNICVIVRYYFGIR